MKRKWISGLGLMERWNMYPMSLLECMKRTGLQAYYPERKQRVGYQAGAYAGERYVRMGGRGRVLRLDYYSEARMFAMLPDLHFPVQLIEEMEKVLDRDKEMRAELTRCR
jgi:hypothetical protein